MTKSKEINSIQRQLDEVEGFWINEKMNKSAKKTGNIIVLYLNSKLTISAEFDQFRRDGKNLVFWDGGEFYENEETGEYIQRDHKYVRILTIKETKCTDD